MLVSWYLIAVARNISLIYAGLVVYSWYKKLLPADKSAQLVLWGYIAVNVLITAFFLEQNLFLTKRYLMALSLILMVWVPFALNDLITQWNKKRWLCIFVLLAMLYYALGGLIDFGYSKRYIRQAADWAAQHVSAADKLYSNEIQLLFYSQQSGFSMFKELSNLVI